MKNFNWLMSMLLMATLAFVACEKDPSDKKGDNDSKNATVEIVVKEVTANTVIYDVTPSAEDVDYFVLAFPANIVEQCASDVEIVDAVYEQIEAYVESVDLTFNAYVAEKVKRGTLTAQELSGLTPKTSYYLLAFCVDAEDNYKAISKVDKQRFTTLDGEATGTCTFTLSTTAYNNTLSIEVTPTLDTQAWYVMVAKFDDFESHIAEDGEFKWTKEQYYVNHLNTEVETLKTQGLNDQQIAEKLLFTGKRTLNVANLESKTKYEIMVAGVELTAEGAKLVTGFKETRLSTKEAAESSLSFDIEVLNIEHYAADIRITPSDLEKEYYYCVYFLESSTKSMSATELVDHYVANYMYYWESSTLMTNDPVKGVQDFTGDNKFKLDIAETEYYIIAFEYEHNPTYGQVIDNTTDEEGNEVPVYDENPGRLVSAPTLVTFVTPDHGDPMEAEFTITYANPTPYGFEIEIATNDDTIYYQPGVIEAAKYDPQTEIDRNALVLSQVLQMSMESRNPCLNEYEALEKAQKQKYPYYNGGSKFGVSTLKPETEYIAYVLVIDPLKREFVRVVASETTMKTTAAGLVNPTAEILGVFNGDNLPEGVEFDKPHEGCPVILVKYDNFEGAASLHAQCFEGDLTDEKYTDTVIYDGARGLWEDVSLDMPYNIFVCVWDIDLTVGVHAIDANGNPGKIGRAVIASDVVEFGDMEQFMEIYNALNPKTDAPEAQALASSLVVADKAVDEPSFNLLWSQKVGAPRTAEVVYHEVEPLKVESDVMTVKVVKSFVF